MNVTSDTLVSLGTLKPGSTGKVSAFETGDTDMIDRLREMGFAEGLDIELLHQSPFGGDPIAVRIDVMTVALRREQANLIKVQIV
ncbi:MAG: ferrous iron transport protein A [Kordiimonas sp.]